MAAIDKTKELIGWLKVTFALLIAIDASLIGWMAQNFIQANRFSLLLAVSGCALISGIAVIVHHRAYQKINQLENL